MISKLRLAIAAVLQWMPFIANTVDDAEKLLKKTTNVLDKAQAISRNKRQEILRIQNKLDNQYTEQLHTDQKAAELKGKLR